MKREIKGDKQIKINGQTVPLNKVRRWRYDNEKDNPVLTNQNERRWHAFMAVKEAWENLNADIMLPELTSDFEYGSYWVNDTMRGLDAYENYIKGKFATISKTNSQPNISIIILREGISPVGYTYALLFKQNSNESLLLFDFTGNKISRLYMTDPDIYAFTDFNGTHGEPGMRQSNSGRVENNMSICECYDLQSLSFSQREKDHKLGINIVYDDLVKEGHKIEAVNTELSKLPQIVVSIKGQLTFIIVLTNRGALPELPPGIKRSCETQAAKFGAVCMFAPVALMPTGQRNHDGEEGFFVNYRGYRNV